MERGTLYDVAQGKDVDDESSYELNVVRVVDDGERSTTALLPDLVERLAKASDDELEAWAEPWAGTEELDCEASDLLPYRGIFRAWPASLRPRTRRCIYGNSV